MRIAAGMDFSPPFTILEGGYSKDDVSGMENDNSENLDSLKQMTNGKPPRHISVIRHCVSTARLLPVAELVSSFCILIRFNCMKLQVKVLSFFESLDYINWAFLWKFYLVLNIMITSTQLHISS